MNKDSRFSEIESIQEEDRRELLAQLCNDFLFCWISSNGNLGVLVENPLKSKEGEDMHIIALSMFLGENPAEMLYDEEHYNHDERIVVWDRILTHEEIKDFAHSFHFW